MCWMGSWNILFSIFRKKVWRLWLIISFYTVCSVGGKNRCKNVVCTDREVLYLEMDSFISTRDAISLNIFCGEIKQCELWFSSNYN